MTWPTVNLAEVAKIDRIGIDPKEIDAGTQYLGLEHIESGGEILCAQTVTNGELASTKFQFDAGHILYGKLRPYLAKIALPEFSGICSTDILPIRPGKQIDRRFLAYFLRMPQNVELAASRSTGINLPRLSPKALAEFDVPLPPLVDQHRIAAILDKADSLCRKRERELTMTGVLLRSVFLDMFGDPASNPHKFPSEPLVNIASKFSDGPFGSNLKSSHYEDYGVRVVRLQNIGVGEFVDDDRAYISERHFESLRKHECLPGDVLVGTLGDPNLRACLLPDHIEKALNKADCVQIRPNTERATGDFICGLLNQPSTEAMAHALILGQTRSRISMGRLKTLVVPIPPLALQNEYSEVSKRIRAGKHRLQHSIVESELLFRSLAQRAFRGEL